MTDVFLKDEGKFFTIGFQSEKAKEVAPKMLPSEWLYGKDVIKADIVNESKPYTKEVLAMYYLTWEEC